jgi:hypothetical protein
MTGRAEAPARDCPSVETGDVSRVAWPVRREAGRPDSYPGRPVLFPPGQNLRGEMITREVNVFCLTTSNGHGGYTSSPIIPDVYMISGGATPEAARQNLEDSLNAPFIRNAPALAEFLAPQGIAVVGELDPLLFDPREIEDLNEFLENLKGLPDER